MDFNKLNSDLYTLSAPHQFAKKPNEFDRGYLKISNCFNDLCYHYEQKCKANELSDENEFQSLIEEYKNGLLKAINEI